MASSTARPHWTDELVPARELGLLPALPSPAKLRDRVYAAVRPAARGSPDRAASSMAPTCGADPSNLLLRSGPLYEAVRDCVEAEPGIPAHTRPAASLLIASVALEDEARNHSTKARLLASAPASAASWVLNASSSAAAATAAAAVGIGGIGVNNSDAGGDDDAAEDAELEDFLMTRSSSGQVVDLLVDLLGEPEEHRRCLAGMVSKYSRQDLAAILKATLKAHKSGNTQTANGAGSRTLGGVFFREAKRFSGAAKRAAVQQQPQQQQQVPSSAQPLRPYQRDVVGMTLVSWGLQPTEELLSHGGGPAEDGGGGVGDGGVGREDLSARFRALARGWVGNWLVTSPTGSGKTRMFVEVARGVIASRPPGGRCAVVVVLVPGVLLTYQHEAAFAAAQLPNTRTGAHSSNNPLCVQTWRAIRSAATGGGYHSIVVVTAASFLNLLSIGEASMEDVDLLVLDEAHHCHDDHPYAKIMVGFYGGASTSGGSVGSQQPRVLAMTASPVSELDMATLHRNMEALLQRLGPARLHVVDNEDPCVAEVLSQPTHVMARVAQRPVDRRIIENLQVFALDAATEIGECLQGVHAEGPIAMGDKRDLEESLAAAVDDAISTDQPLVGRLNELGQWLSRARRFASKYDCPNLALCGRLLDVIRKGVELAEDAGFEGALPFLGRKAAVLCRDELNGATRPPGAAGAGAASLAPSASGGLAAAAQDTAAPPPPANSCGDISLRVSLLLKDLLIDESGVLSSPGMAALLPDCFTSGELQKESTFPKFWELVEYLQRYRERESFHGIIFVRTRQAVFHLADMIRRTQQLQFVEALELIGHSNTATAKKKRWGPPSGYGASEQDRHSRGMSDVQQQQVLCMFKEPGRKVLVATSTAEEGLDVPSCEFVVRYNAAATGIQLLQSRGRARQRAAEFFVILQNGTVDPWLHDKSRLEEANMAKWQREATAATQETTGP